MKNKKSSLYGKRSEQLKMCSQNLFLGALLASILSKKINEDHLATGKRGVTKEGGEEGHAGQREGQG